MANPELVGEFRGRIDMTIAAYAAETAARSRVLRELTTKVGGWEFISKQGQERRHHIFGKTPSEHVWGVVTPEWGHPSVNLPARLAVVSLLEEPDMLRRILTFRTMHPITPVQVSAPIDTDEGVGGVLQALRGDADALVSLCCLDAAQTEQVTQEAAVLDQSTRELTEALVRMRGPGLRT